MIAPRQESPDIEHPIVERSQVASVDRPSPALAEQEAHLRAIVRGLESCIVAFSGGVDSALMLAVANQELGDRAVGITARSESLAEREYAGALDFAAQIEANHVVVETRELDNPRYAANPTNRCYFCKHELYDKLTAIAKDRGARYVVDGYNLDDDGDYRPGRQAAREFGVRSPLHEAGFRKADVRLLAQSLGLEVWDKPALACLSSRFPHGTPITFDLLRQVDRAERAILDAGLPTCRVRHHGDIARIEVPADALPLLMDRERCRRVVARVREAGYRYVTLDLGGYVAGSMNPT